MAVVLLTSILAGAYLLWKDSQRGGMLVNWSYSGQDGTYGQSRFALGFIGPDGTIYGTETPGPIDSNALYMSSFIAIDPNGTLKWKIGTNAFPGLTVGANGGYYYVDWPERSVWDNNQSLAGWYNLTALDSSGRYKWSVLMNGTLDIWATYPDGTVILHHFENEFNSSGQGWVTLVDEILAVADNGTVRWRMDHPSPSYSFTDPRVSANGTLLVTVYNETDEYRMGIREDGSQAFTDRNKEYIAGIPSPYSTNGTTLYSAETCFIDNQTSETRAYAVNMSSGEQLWSTVLSRSDNPDHIPPGVCRGGYAVVDGKGIVYCNDFDGSSFALSSNGTILWQRPSLGLIWATYPDGGLLVSDGSIVKKINMEGSTAWRYDVGQLGEGSVILTDNGTILYSSGTTIYALALSDSLSSDQWLIVMMVMVDGLLVIAYAITSYRHRKG
jgi:hypothetical protein